MKLLFRLKKKRAAQADIEADHVQPLVILKQQPELSAIYDELLQADAEADRKVEELKQMALRITEVRREAAEKRWKKLIDKATEMGLIPADVKPGKTHALAVKHGTLVMQSMADADRCDCPFCLIRRMTERG